MYEYYEIYPNIHPKLYSIEMNKSNQSKLTDANPVINIAAADASTCWEHSNVATNRPRKRAKL
jgi:hypothetical protein